MEKLTELMFSAEKRPVLISNDPAVFAMVMSTLTNYEKWVRMVSVIHIYIIYTIIAKRDARRIIVVPGTCTYSIYIIMSVTNVSWPAGRAPPGRRSKIIQSWLNFLGDYYTL